MTLTPPPPGTIQVWSDLLCPFAAVALHRLRAARDRLGVELQLDHHVFALELFNGPHPRRGTDTEAVGLGQVEPGAELRVWTARDDLYPHTVLLAAPRTAGCCTPKATGEHSSSIPETTPTG